MIKVLDDKLNYFELEDLVKEEGYIIPTSNDIDNYKEPILFNRVWVSDILNNEYIDAKHNIYDLTTKLLIPTPNLYKIDSVVLVTEAI